MAALRLGIQNILKKNPINQIGATAAYASTPKTALGGLSLVDRVVTTVDNSTFVAYHPTREFPYELSKPLPPPADPTSYLIKDDAIAFANKAFSTKHPELVREELRRITYTTKHIWFPKARSKKAKKTPMNREYL